jgi:hypothetical protein
MGHSQVRHSLCNDTSSNLIGYTDYDWVGDLNDHNSTSSYSFHLGSNPICWQSKKQHAIALSSTEVEYQGVVNAATEAIWLHNILTKLGITFHMPSVVYCDNQSAIQISKNPVHHQ